MSAAVIDPYPDCFYNKCHKKLNPSTKSIACNSCESRCHWYCAKNSLTMYRGQSYCRECLKQKDLIRYNPYFEVNSYDIDDNEKTHLHNRISSSATEFLSPLSDIMENCTINDIDTFNKECFPNDSLKFQFLNIDGNASNFDTFTATLSAISHEFSIIGITETNIASSQKDSYKLAGFNSIYEDSVAGKKKGSGVALYIRDSMNFSKLSEYSHSSKDIESLFITLRKEDYTSTVGIVYRPPSGDISTFIKYMSEALKSLSNEKNDTIIMGDFNINMFIDNRISSSFEDIMICNGFTPTISVATHIKTNCLRSCIDNILVNKPNNVYASGVIDTQISHHRSLFLNYKLPTVENVTCQSKRTNTDRIKYDFCIKNLDKLNNLLSSRLRDQKQVLNYESFLNIFTKSMNETCMLKTTKVSKRNKVRNPWITSGIINSIANRDQLYKKWKKSITKTFKLGDPGLYEDYRRYRNNLSNVIKKCKQQYYSVKFENATGNLKKTWAIINELRGKHRNNLPSYFKIDGSVVSEDKDIANSFNSYFSSLAENMNKSIDKRSNVYKNYSEFLPNVENSSLFLEDATVNEILEIISDLSNDKASDIPVVVIKHCNAIISPILANIFNKCIERWNIPRSIKNW